MSEQEIPRAKIEAAFKAWKKNGDAAILKIYDDGGVRVIDSLGVIKEFDTPDDFLKYARRFEEWSKKA